MNLMIYIIRCKEDAVSELDVDTERVALWCFQPASSSRRIYAFWVNAFAVAHPCGYIAHLKSQANGLQTETGAERVGEVIAKNKVAQLHIVGMVNVLITIVELVGIEIGAHHHVSVTKHVLTVFLRGAPVVEISPWHFIAIA